MSTSNNNIELRHLSVYVRNRLVSILDCNDSWKELAAVIKKSNFQEDEPLFTVQDIRILEDQKYKNISPSESLLESWSTYGRKSERPTAETVLELLKRCELIQAANIIAVEVLKGDQILWKPDLSPSSSSESLFLANLSHSFISFKYSHLQESTNNFNDELVHLGGNKLGEGAFGTVYLATLEPMAIQVAVKRLKERLSKQFSTELEVLSRFQCDYLLPLLGYSTDSPKACLIYKFMTNGSLMDKLQERSNPLTCVQRVSIAFGTAKGIAYLHNYLDKPYVHRDIKSANILLDENMDPKVGDFGLVRIGASDMSTACKTTTVFGTSAYMAPEAINGDVSEKLDVFSFGIVLFELLTSLLPLDTNRDDHDLKSHIEAHYDEEIKGIKGLSVPLDVEWDILVADEVFKLALKCIEYRKRDRPVFRDIVPILETQKSTVEAQPIVNFNEQLNKMTLHQTKLTDFPELFFRNSAETLNNN